MRKNCWNSIKFFLRLHVINKLLYGCYVIWSGQIPWWNWYLTPVVNFDEARRAHLAKYTLPPPRRCPWDLFRNVKVCGDAKERVGCGKQREPTAPIQSLVKMHHWFLSLRWKPFFRQNCSPGSCVCSEGPALGRTLMMIWGFSARQHHKSFAPVMNDDCDGQWYPGMDGPTFPNIILTVEEKPQKNLIQETVPTGDRTRAR